MRQNLRLGRLASAAAAAVLGFGLLTAPASVSSALAEAGFERWVASFRQTAAAHPLATQEAA